MNYQCELKDDNKYALPEKRLPNAKERSNLHGQIKRFASTTISSSVSKIHRYARRSRLYHGYNEQRYFNNERTSYMNTCVTHLDTSLISYLEKPL